jgi:hypothetical protein
MPLRWGVFDTTLCDKVCQWLATGRCFSKGIPDKTDHHNNIYWNIVESGIKDHNPYLCFLLPDLPTRVNKWTRNQAISSHHLCLTE